MTNQPRFFTHLLIAGVVCLSSFFNVPAFAANVEVTDEHHHADTVGSSSTAQDVLKNLNEKVSNYNKDTKEDVIKSIHSMTADYKSKIASISDSVSRKELNKILREVETTLEKVKTSTDEGKAHNLLSEICKKLTTVADKINSTQAIEQEKSDK